MLEDNVNETELENADDLDIELDLDDVDLDTLALADDGDEDNNEDENTLDEATAATAAAATIAAKPSRTATLASIVSHAAGLSDEDLNGFAKSITKPNDPIPAGAAAKNKATIATKTVTKEEMEELFGDDLSEEFREKTMTLFESAVNARVALDVAALAEDLDAKYAATTAALEEAYATTLEEEVNTFTDGLYEQVDSYINYVAENWMSENEVAIDKSLRADIAEDFMNKMKDLFLEHNLNIPDEAEDVLEEMLGVNEELEAKLNEVLAENITLKAGKVEEGITEAFAEATTGLAATQIDRIRSLAEGIEHDDLETYTKKLQTIKEAVTRKAAPSSGILQEEAPAVTEDELNEDLRPQVTDPRMQAYLKAIPSSNSR